jgi:pimeloyl-ACP methyl ester carboxylesterase
MPAPPLLLFLSVLALLQPVALAIPADAHFFQQKVDHFSVDDRTYLQRYYMNDTTFAGPGSPIFMIMGGEGGIEPSTGIFYPSIVQLAQRLHGFVVEPEHRFYGASQPLQSYSTQTLHLLTSAQALADAAALLNSIREQLKCTGLNGEPRCPAVAIGGSYPGFLAAMMRIRYPNVVDMAYSASAPLRFYSQVQPAGCGVYKSLMIVDRLSMSLITIPSSLRVQNGQRQVVPRPCVASWLALLLLPPRRTKSSRNWACATHCHCTCRRAAMIFLSMRST